MIFETFFRESNCSFLYIKKMKKFEDLKNIVIDDNYQTKRNFGFLHFLNFFIQLL